MINISQLIKPHLTYFKSITLHEFLINEEHIKVRLHQEPENSTIFYWNHDSSYWTVDAPQVINTLGRDEEGVHLFEHWLPMSEEMDFEKWKKEHVIYV